MTLDFQNDRNATLKLIDWFDIDRVQSAKILVIGAGAIGNEVLKNLALLGIGNIYIFDRDTIEMANLSRSVLFHAADNGLPKATTAARAIQELNPEVRVKPTIGDVRFDLGLGLLRRMDAVIGCLDNRVARLSINRASWKAGRPWIDAGIGQLNGQVRVYKPGQGACYECSFTKEDYQQVVVPCHQLASKYTNEGKIPTTPTIASVVAGVQVQEALKLLSPAHWQGRTLVGKQFIFNGTVGFAEIGELVERDDCLSHSTIDPSSITELPGCKSNQTTVRDLLKIARRVAGKQAVIDLNFELALEIRCPLCKAIKQTLCPADKLFLEDLNCEACNHNGYVVTSHTLGNNPTNYAEVFLDKRLSDLNIAPLDILRVRGAKGVVHFLELTGDKEEVL